VIRDTTFTDCRNDAIDISGSSLEVSGIRILGAGDKGLSAGEDSELRGTDIEIQRAAIAVASKDRSRVSLRDVQIADSGLGFAAFQKKPEFGGAEIEVQNLEFAHIEEDFMVEKGSSMKVDGRAIPTMKGKVEDRLYGVEYGKASE
jgi:hypothetical protein